MLKKIALTINGKSYSGEAEPRTLLVHFLRDNLRLTGTHIGCVVGRCGACTVLWNGTAVKSCMVFAIQVNGGEIITIEGLAQDKQLHPIQDAFWRNDAAECGYCTPGMIMSAYSLLMKTKNPTEGQIKAAISGNLCRCTGYRNIVNAIKAASGEASTRVHAGVTYYGKHSEGHSD